MNNSELKYNDLALGFHLPGVDITTLSATPLLKSSEPWEQFLGVLVGCTQGDFSQLPRLGPLLKKNDGYLFCAACCHLVGCAGSWKIITDFCEELEAQAKGNASLMIEPVAYTLQLSCNLNAVEYLLRLFDLSSEEDDRICTEQAMTTLLCENVHGFLNIGGHEFLDESDTRVNRPGHNKRVADLYTHLRAKIGHSPVVGGKIYDVAEMANTLQYILAPDSGFNSSDIIYPYDMLFEAATGISFSLTWNTPAQRKLVIGGTERILNVSHDYPGARSIIESFLQRKDLDRYEPGQRYFFGHPIE